jgi:hypothetical protein
LKIKGLCLAFQLLQLKPASQIATDPDTNPLQEKENASLRNRSHMHRFIRRVYGPVR